MDQAVLNKSINGLLKGYRERAGGDGVRNAVVVADRGYFKIEEILACHDANIIVRMSLTDDFGSQSRWALQQ